MISQKAIEHSVRTLRKYIPRDADIIEMLSDLMSISASNKSFHNSLMAIRTKVLESRIK
jgi:hypothetical protein